MNTEYSATVTLKNGVGYLNYQHFFTENLNATRIAVLSLYSDSMHLTPVCITVNACFQRFDTVTYNILAMSSISRPRQTVQFNSALNMSMNYCPQKLEFRALNIAGKTETDFNGTILVKLSSSRYKQNPFV